MAQSSEPAASGSAGGRATRTTEPSAGSRTETQTHAQPQGPILTLTGAHDRSRGPRVRWDENVVDNEGMGKKSSKGTRGALHFPFLVASSSVEHPFTDWPFFLSYRSLLYLPRTQGNGRI